MKILFYNWVDYLDDENRGGGVSVYQRNLIRALDARDDAECTFISSGISYDLFNRQPRWERVRHGPTENRARRFEIVNSGVLSPSHHSFGDPRQVDDPATVETFFDFIEKKGPFDVVHFNNFEGIPVSVLALKERFPDTRVVFSLHNYYPVCPQVNLWFNETAHCADYDEGRKCMTCLPFRPDTRIVELANAVAFNLKKWGIRPGTRIFDRAFSPAMRLGGRAARLYQRRIAPRLARGRTSAKKELLKRIEAPHVHFTRRRAEITRLINTHCDAVLCVSDRVGEIAKNYGIDPDLVHTSYIGTRHAEKFQETSPRSSLVKEDGTVTLAYLGYMRRDKGFFFLLDALDALPQALTRRLHLVLCSRLINAETLARIERLSAHFASVRFADGYAHDQLDALLKDVDLGLIPVLWEDNLPQVAIEMHARHIPLLTSDMGGAKELGNAPDLVFRAGDKASFTARINAALSGEIDMHAYWARAMAPYSMDDHLKELLPVYRGKDAPVAAEAAETADEAPKKAPPRLKAV
ncbi:MAG: glycosyltransferase [Alphaproteobacteria bacterium]|nr:glycosyltransferase [Alphaproteobacteria bacterium]